MAPIRGEPVVNLEKRQFLKAIGLLVAGYVLHSALPHSMPVSAKLEVSGDRSARVRVENGALVVDDGA